MKKKIAFSLVGLSCAIFVIEIANLSEAKAESQALKLKSCSYDASGNVTGYTCEYNYRKTCAIISCNDI